MASGGVPVDANRLIQVGCVPGPAGLCQVSAIVFIQLDVCLSLHDDASLMLPGNDDWLHMLLEHDDWLMLAQDTCAWLVVS